MLPDAVQFDPSVSSSPARHRATVLQLPRTRRQAKGFVEGAEEAGAAGCVTVALRTPAGYGEDEWQRPSNRRATGGRGDGYGGLGDGLFRDWGDVLIVGLWRDKPGKVAVVVVVVLGEEKKGGGQKSG